jgi:hypothetical protein
MAIVASLEHQARHGSVPKVIGAACDTLALIGVAAGSLPLFLHGWVDVAVRFASRTPSGSGVFGRLGADVDTQIAAIAAHEVNATIAPTLWQYPSHLFQALFALLLLVAAATLVARTLPLRRRILARGCACLGSVAAALLVAVAVVRINARIAALPLRINEAMQGNALAKQALAATESTPQVSGGPGWPLIIVAVGVALALIGTLIGLLFALRRADTPGILPGTRGMPADRK